MCIHPKALSGPNLMTKNRKNSPLEEISLRFDVLMEYERLPIKDRDSFYNNL